MKLDIDSFNRLSLGIMEKNRCGPQEALQRLTSLYLHLECGEAIRWSLPLQAALLTAVNTGKRAFLGGISVTLPPDVPCLLPWPEKKGLNDIVSELGGSTSGRIVKESLTLTFGLPASIDSNSMQVVCNDWQAAVLTGHEPCPFDLAGTIPTAGIFAGALGVCQAFLKSSGLQLAAGDRSVGLSLWRPDLPWSDPQATGPAVLYLPKKIWLLGLGHLGQAYLWSIGLLPYSDPSEATILLQDDDKMVSANWSAGLLTEIKDIENKYPYKTRICSRWLESRGFNTLITERRFDGFTRRMNEEPFLALCGFDSADSRLPLENAGFDLIVESGLGGDMALFDRVSLHTFPDAKQTPLTIWGTERDEQSAVNGVVYEQLKDLTDEICGILPLSIAERAVSASFVGACAGALVIAEILRGLNNGMRYDKITLHLRDLPDIQATIHKNAFYSFEQSRNGFTLV
jgi:hypothetical protein